MEELETITLNGVEHAFESLSDKAKYIVTQIQSLQALKKGVSLELDRHEMAIQGFTKHLEAEVEG